MNTELATRYPDPIQRAKETLERFKILWIELNNRGLESSEQAASEMALFKLYDAVLGIFSKENTYKAQRVRAHALVEKYHTFDNFKANLSSGKRSTVVLELKTEFEDFLELLTKMETEDKEQTPSPSNAASPEQF